MKLRMSASKVFFSWRNLIWMVGIHALAVVGLYFFTWPGFFLFLTMHYLVGMVGITFGFHRLLTHRGFKTYPIVEYISAFFGTLACQSGPISWVGQHRVHHAYSDQPQDPHNSKRGFWYSHIGFLFQRRQDLDDSSEIAHYCPDIAKNKVLWFFEKYMVHLQIAVGILFLLCGGLFGANAGFDWHLGASLVFWGIFIRLAVGYHVTWLVNSATHKWGQQPNKSGDCSRNNWPVGLLAFGEGWHNNHHAQPRSARHGWLWWQFDQTWILISVLKKLGLVWKIVLPKKEAAAHPIAAQPATEPPLFIVPATLND